MNLLIGIGNSDRGDDGIGPWVAAHLDAPNWEALDGGLAPENLTGVVRRRAPALLVLVDAAEMGLSPGTVRRIPRDRIEDCGLGTHMLPLHHLMAFLDDCVPAIELIGIQPANTAYGADLTPAVRAAGQTLLAALAAGQWSHVPVWALPGQ